MTSTYKRYLSVTKPGIIMGNAISVTGGFLLASRGDIDYWLLLAALIGLSLVWICVFTVVYLMGAM